MMHIETVHFEQEGAAAHPLSLLQKLCQRRGHDDASAWQGCSLHGLQKASPQTLDALLSARNLVTCTLQNMKAQSPIRPQSLPSLKNFP